MSLPASRNTTYDIGSLVKHDDLNAIQDQIIAAFLVLAWSAKQTFHNGVAIDGGSEPRLDVTGNIQASGTIKATGTLKHDGDETLRFGPRFMHASADWTINGALESFRATAGAPNVAYTELVLPVGRRITAVRCEFQTSSGTANADFRLRKIDDSTGTITNQSNSVTSANNSNRQTVTLTGITPTAIGANERWQVTCTGNGSAATRDCFSVAVDFDNP